MSRVAELIDLIVQGKNAEASDVLNSELMTRSYDSINSIKQQVAADYFAPVVDMSNAEEAPQMEYSEPETVEPEESE